MIKVKLNNLENVDPTKEEKKRKMRRLSLKQKPKN